MLLLDGLPVLLEIGLFVYCLIDAITTPGDEVRNLPKGAWIVVIILLPLIGGIAWLVAGKPTTRRRDTWAVGSGFPEHERPRNRSVAPDDDPAFLAQLRQVDQEHRDSLQAWEQSLREREARLRDQDGEATNGTGDPAPA